MFMLPANIASCCGGVLRSLVLRSTSHHSNVEVPFSLWRMNSANRTAQSLQLTCCCLLLLFSLCWQQTEASATQLVNTAAINNGHSSPTNTTTTSSSAVAALFDIATQRVPLFANSGTHHVEIFAGQPPVPQALIVDTGSRLTSWLCHEDPHRDTPRKFLYTPNHSNTMQNISCEECQFEGDSRCGRLVDAAAAAAGDGVSAKQSYPERCVVQQRYTEGSSWTAYEVNDIVSLPAISSSRRRLDGQKTQQHRRRSSQQAYEDSLSTAIPFTFGCQTEVTGLFKNQMAHGILGLERYSHQSLPAQLFRHGVTHSRSFSLCISATAGWLGLGGALPDTHLEPMKLTPLLEKSQTKQTKAGNRTVAAGMYSVYVEEFWLDDICLASATFHPERLDAFHEGKGTILDSGTTDTYLPEAFKEIFSKAWSGYTGTPHTSQKRKYHREEFLALPEIRYVFTGGATLVVPAAHYMEGASVFDSVRAPQSKHSVTSTVVDEARLRKLATKRYGLQNRVYASERVGAVLGINSILGYNILFDADNEQIGFARANCD